MMQYRCPYAQIKATKTKAQLKGLSCQKAFFLRDMVKLQQVEDS